ncbi:MAG: hypothetical protein ACLT1J_05740 [Mediterraneibacter gnavus]
MQRKSGAILSFFRPYGQTICRRWKRWHEKYIQMEKLDETAKDTFAAEKFGKISGEFPGNGWPLNLRWQSLCNGVIMDADYEKNVIKERI